MRKQKILIFHPYLTPYRIDLYNSLNDLFKVEALLTGGEKEIKSLGFDLSYVNKQAKFLYRYTRKGFYVGRHLVSNQYCKVIYLFKPDVIIAHEMGFNTWVALFLKYLIGYRVFVTIDDSPKMFKSRRGFRKVIQKVLFSLVDKIIVVHPDVRADINTSWGKNKAIFFPIIQDERKVRQNMENSVSQSLKQKYEQKISGRKIILFVGRLEEIKCPTLLLEVFHELNYPDSKLVIIGNGKLRNTIDRYVTANKLEDKVILTGQLTGGELYFWYYMADVFVLPSQHEPFGAVVNEALIAGCRVIVSDRVGASCLINESNGFVFKTNDRISLRTSLEKELNRKENSNHSRKESMMIFEFNEFFSELIEAL